MKKRKLIRILRLPMGSSGSRGGEDLIRILRLPMGSSGSRGGECFIL